MPANAVLNVSMPAWTVTLGPNQSLTIDGQGSTIMFINNGSTSTSWNNNMANVQSTGIALNTTFSLLNITFDMWYPPYAQGTYVGNPSSGVFTFASDGTVPDPLFTSVYGMYEFNPAKDTLIWQLASFTNTVLTVTSPGQYSMSGTSFIGATTGYPVVLLATMLAYPVGIWVYGIDNVLYSGVTVYAAPQAGITNQWNGNILMYNTYVGRKPGRLMGTNSDLVPIESLRGNLHVANSTFGWGGDDIMNIKSYCFIVESPTGPASNPVVTSSSTSITVYVHHLIQETLATTYNTFSAYDNTGAYVMDPSSSNGIAVFTVEQTGGYTTGVVGFNGDSSYAEFVLTGTATAIAALPLNSSLTGYIFHYIANNVVLIENNVFTTGRSVGIRPDLTFNTVIRNNSFTNLWSGAIGYTPYIEGAFPSNLVISGNTFIYSNIYNGASAEYGVIGLYSSPAWSNVSGHIASTVDTPPQSALGQFNLSIVNNIITFYDDYGPGATTATHGNAIVIAGATNVIISNNTINLTNIDESKYGVYVEWGNTVSILNNTIIGAVTSCGVFVDGNSTNITNNGVCTPTPLNGVVPVPFFAAPLMVDYSYSFLGAQAATPMIFHSENTALSGFTNFSGIHAWTSSTSVPGQGVFTPFNVVLTPSYTKCAWVNLSTSDVTSRASIIASVSFADPNQYSADAGAHAFFMYGSSLSMTHNPINDVTPSYSGNSEVISASLGSSLLNQWHHACGTYNDVSRTAALYWDGAFLAQATFTNAWSTTTAEPIQIGGWTLESEAFQWMGSLRDIRVFNSSLSAVQVQLVYQSSPPFTNSTLVAANSPKLLDTTPPQPVLVAVSLRQLFQNATRAIRVVRSSDGSAMDIGFTSTGILNTTALLTFVGAGNGSVVIWYDQGFLSAHMTSYRQAPLIVVNGQIVLSLGVPALSFNGTQVLAMPAYVPAFGASMLINRNATNTGPILSSVAGWNNYASAADLINSGAASYAAANADYWVNNNFYAFYGSISWPSGQNVVIQTQHLGGVGTDGETVWNSIGVGFVGYYMELTVFASAPVGSIISTMYSSEVAYSTSFTACTSGLAGIGCIGCSSSNSTAWTCSSCATGYTLNGSNECK
jgi:hypothetical protein